jgi:hypothetical protein
MSPNEAYAMSAQKCQGGSLIINVRTDGHKRLKVNGLTAATLGWRPGCPAMITLLFRCAVAITS